MESPRFKVVELDGYVIRDRPLFSWPTPMLSVSVIDTAACYREVARFNEEDELRKRRGGYPTKEARRETLRNRAHGLAAMLEADHA